MKTTRAPKRSARSSADLTAFSAVPEPSVPTATVAIILSPRVASGGCRKQEYRDPALDSASRGVRRARRRLGVSRRQQRRFLGRLGRLRSRDADSLRRRAGGAPARAPDAKARVQPLVRRPALIDPVARRPT